jgi:hypothetical protein
MKTHPVQYFILGVMTLTDARYFSALEVDYLHFDLNPDSPYAISTPAFRAIIEWVEGSEIICSFDHLFEEELIREIVEDKSVSGVLSQYPDLLDYVHRIRPELKLFQEIAKEVAIDWQLTLTGILGDISLDSYDNHFLLCHGPLEAEQAIKNGKNLIAIHPGNEDEVGIKDFEAYDRLLYQEF